MALPQTRKASGDYDGMEVEGKQKNSTIGGGFGAFIDATYDELGFGIDFATNKEGKSEMTVDGDTITTDPPDYSTGISYFSFSLLGKYPIALGSKITLSPMVGFDWNIAMSTQHTDADGEKGDKIKRADFVDKIFGGESDYKTSFDVFLINVGAGADFALTEKLYLRLSAMYGFKIKSKSEKDWITSMKDGENEFDTKMDDASVFTGGPTVKLGVGYKF
jgi:opacity protein-like surface antigen